MSGKRILFWLVGAGLIGLTVLSMVFFTSYEVKSVEVRGNSKYTDEEVKELVLTGFFSRNSLLAPFFCKSRGDTENYLVDSWSVSRVSNDTIAINFNEKKPVGCIRYLDSYVYFDRNGCFVDASIDRKEQLPYFNGIVVNQVTFDEKLPMKGTTVLNTAVTLATIFQKDDRLPDSIDFDSKNQVILTYDDVQVVLGKNENLEDKMERIQAILPMIEGEKGTLHLESVTDNIKTVTFEKDEGTESTSGIPEWDGGYDVNGEYTGEGEYNAKGKYVGEKPLSDLDNAIASWTGGYDGEGDFTGSGEFDEYGNYAGEKPTEDSFAALGDYKGGYDDAGHFTWEGEYDRYGNYVGPNTGSASDGQAEGGEASQGSSINIYFNNEDENSSESREDTGPEGSTAENPDASDTGEDYSGDYTEEYSGWDEETDWTEDGSDYTFDENEDGGIYDEAYYDALYEGIYW